MAWFREFWSDEGGQGIVEYAACIAFTAVLIIMVFSISQGTLADALFTAYSNMAGELDRLNQAAANGGP